MIWVIYQFERIYDTLTKQAAKAGEKCNGWTYSDFKVCRHEK